jgi:hypothetical protein
MEQFNRIEIFWICEREIDNYVRFAFEIGMTITGLKDVEIEKGGVKIKRKAGTLEFRITSYIEKDFENKWSGTKFRNVMREAYDKYIVKDRLNKYRLVLYDELKAFMTEIRSFLHLHSIH